MARPIEFHFDFMSPYSYLATTRVGSGRPHRERVGG